jgi:succinate dehydrogenase/fumarate reductase flavoprotein subunit
VREERVSSRARFAVLSVLVLMAGCQSQTSSMDSSYRRPSDTEGTETGEPEAAPSREVEVLIVGAGVAGMAAASVLDAAGVDYLIIDLDTQMGGTALYTGGWMTFSGSSTQSSAEIEDSPELLLSEWEGMTGGSPDDPWVQSYASRNVEVHDWFVEQGIDFALTSLASDGASVRRIHMPDGGGDTIARVLRDDIDESRVWLQTRCTELILGSDGGIVGARVQQESGESWIQAEATVVATGGFLRDLERVAWARPDLDVEALWFASGPQALGTGHQMLDDVGAAWDNASAISIYAHGVADPRTDGEELVLLASQSLVMVNAQGERFTREAPDNSYGQGRDLVSQSEQLGFYVFDAGTRGQLMIHDPMVLEAEGELPLLDELESSGQLVKAESLEELAAGMGIDTDGLVATVAAVNRSLDEGSDDVLWGEPLQVARIEAPPFFGIRVVPTLAKAFGGIEVHTDGRVVDVAGEFIPGLYAAGELTGMAGGSLVEDGGFTGSLSAVMLSGWVVAESLSSAR